MSNGWNEYQKLVIFRLDELGKALSKVGTKLDEEDQRCEDDRASLRAKAAEVQTTLALLKQKAGLWAAAAAAIPASVFALWKIFG